MSDSPNPPQTPHQRLNKEYEDPHYHDEDDTRSLEEGEPQRGHHGKAAPRRKPVYRPRRRFLDD